MITIKITIKDIIIGGIVVVFTAIAFEQPAFLFKNNTPTRNVLQVEIEHFISDNIISLSATEIAKKLENNNGKATLMVFYASWCSYCKQLIPDILSLQKEGKLDNVELFFLSVDKDKTELAGYLLKHSYDNFFTPYILERNGEEALESMLMKKGHLYSGGLPYTVIFDNKGNVSSAIRGLTSKKNILDKVAQVKATQ